jgi:hypothetical protein
MRKVMTVMCICTYSIYVVLRRNIKVTDFKLSRWLVIDINSVLWFVVRRGTRCLLEVAWHGATTQQLVLTKCPEIRDLRLHHFIPQWTLICLLVRKRSVKKFQPTQQILLCKTRLQLNANYNRVTGNTPQRGNSVTSSSCSRCHVQLQSHTLFILFAIIYRSAVLVLSFCSQHFIL